MKYVFTDNTWKGKSDMIIRYDHDKLTTIDAVVFDFDGTLSSLRSGWEEVMEPLMCEYIPGEPDEVKELVKKYIDESTGIQTIHQMRCLPLWDL